MKYLFPQWIIVSILLFLYSYTQVDLSLTLSQDSIYRTVQGYFQYIGWFNRPLSTYLYIGLIIILFVSFFQTIRAVVNNKIESKIIFKCVGAVAAILIFSYIAFSYDMFNYIFDAKIVTHYFKNPYELKALDFPADPMLSFMRSTHRAYPYGPSWLFITVPISFIGANIFSITFFLFKALSAASYIGTCFLLNSISKKLGLKNPLLVVVLFAFNPLIIIESLVSSHNEIVMMFLAVFSVWALIRTKKTYSFLTIVFSVGIKYSTIFIAPIIFLAMLSKRVHAKERLLPLLLIFSLVAVAVTAFSSGPNKNPEFQPWYLLTAAPFVALFENKLARSIFVCVCLFSLFSYIPFLYVGTWPENIVLMKNILIVTGVVVGFGAFLGIKMYSKR